MYWTSAIKILIQSELKSIKIANDFPFDSNFNLDRGEKTTSFEVCGK